MLRLTRLTVLIGVAFFLTTHMTAQPPTDFYRQQGDYTFGINGGVAYQQSDVASSLNGFGLGLTYGKNLLYAPNTPFSIDVRSRMQFARSSGLDIRPSLGIANNTALNGERTLDYTGEEEGGLVYANYRTQQAELGLEGVLTLNGLRENTGLGLSFTGGVGLNWYKTKIDQSDANGLYNEQYSRVDAGGTKPYNLSQLKSFRDGKYETLADNFGSLGKFGIMPSVGVELDYDLTKNLALGVGHRITFSGTDLLDGQRWTDANNLTGNNDLLHYTSLGLKYTFNKNGGKKEKNRKPFIELVEPYNNLSTTQAVIPIKARISRVDNPFDIYVTVNGKQQTFNYTKNTLAGNIRLQPGENRIEITANNRAGTYRETFFLQYKVEETLGTSVLDFGKPQIEFTNPNLDNVELDRAQIELRAKVRLVENHKDIELRINGKKSQFDFDKGIEVLDARIALRTGKNTIEIRAKNRNGAVRVNRVIYRKAPIPFPTVNFISPAYNNATVNNRMATVKIELRYVEQSTDVQLFVNGRKVPNVYFDNQIGQVEAAIELREGRNQVKITAINARGEASDERTIVYERPYRPTIRRPRITLNSPQYRTSTTSDEVVTIHATLENIYRKSDIRLTNNGLGIYDFDFNPNTGILRHNLYLREGLNRIKIAAQNEAGVERAEATINFELPLLPPPPTVVVVPAPSIAIYYPKRNEVFEVDEINIKANLVGIVNKQEIELIVNRNDCVDFRYNPENGRFRATIPLQEGRNEIILKAANPSGQDYQKITVFHERPYAPIIDLSRPNYTTTAENRLEIKATIEHIENKRDIQLALNDRTIRDFRFKNNQLEATLHLAEGNNKIELIAENKYGNDRKTWEVVYRIPQPPSIAFQNMFNNQTIRQNRYKLEAIVHNVEDIKNIKLFVNGVLAKGVALTDNHFTAHILLKEGRNSIVLKAKTTHGNDEQKLLVNYLRPHTTPVKKPSTSTVSKNGKVAKGKVTKTRKSTIE